MPVVGGERRSRVPGYSGYNQDPLAPMCKEFLNEANAILSGSRIDLFRDPIYAINEATSRETLKEYFVNNSADVKNMSAEELEDHVEMMNEQFENDVEGIMEYASISQYNPVIGMSFPIHKNLMMNCMFDKGAIPKFVATQPKFTVSMETRWLIHPVTGKKIDFWKNQWEMTDAIEAAAPMKSMFIPLPETENTNVLMEMFGTQDRDAHLSIETCITGLVGSKVVFPGQRTQVVYSVTNGSVTTNEIGTYINNTSNAVVVKAGVQLDVVSENGSVGTQSIVGAVFKYNAKFSTAYGEYDRQLVEKFSVPAVDSAAASSTLAGTWDLTVKGETVVGATSDKAIPANLKTNGHVMAYFKEDKLGILVDVPTSDSTGTGATAAGIISGVILTSRIDTSTAKLNTAQVTWDTTTTQIEIPNAIPINVPISPEEVKDIALLYQVQQLTKVMSLIKTSLENYKDDKIHRGLNKSYINLPDDCKLARQIDFAPATQNYAIDPVAWRKTMFMDQLDTHVTQLLHILNDANVTINIIGRDDLIRKVTPTEYTYTSPTNIGPVELSYAKTVCTSDKRTYQFLSSDKLRDTNNLMIILCPRNSERFMYRLYDYQMYVSNEIRNYSNPTLPAIHAFERWTLEEYQAVQARIRILNPTGLRNYGTDYAYNLDPIGRGDGVAAYGKNNFDIDAI